MFISKVSLINYKNFSNACFYFNKGINTIIGENGSGKTNVFRAIRLLLEDSSLQYAYKLSESDFNRTLDNRTLDNGKWKGHWIIISIEFDEINDEEAIQALFIHGAGIIKDKSVKKATYNLFFRPKADIRQKLSELKLGDRKGLENLLEGLTIEENYETLFTGKSTADFNDPNVYKELVGDFENVSFPSTNLDALKFGAKIPHQLSVSKEISFTFIQALRDVVSDFHNNRTNPLLNLLKNKSGEITEASYKPINDLVKKLNDKIEELDDVQNIRKDIKTTIQGAVGQTYSPSSLSIRSSVPNDPDKLLQSLKLYIGEPYEDYEGGIHELSLGGANLIFLTLKLLEFQYRKSQDTHANFLMIEEPEAHIHNHIQKTLFDKLNYGDTQIIYSTHSTQISEVSNVENINILAKKLNYTEVYQPANNLKPENINQIQRYLDAVRTNLLFAKGVILIEGDAEEILIPIMIKKLLGISLDELGISLINIRSTGFENVAQLFHKDRIKRNCAILTDLDEAICDTKVNEDDDIKTIKYKNLIEASKKKGKARKEKLDIFQKGNPWLKTFYASYTFEVDFIKAGNSWEVVQTLKSTYKDQTTVDLAKKELESKNVSIYGRRVLTIAKQEGKGWFAIKLGKYISFRTYLPEYILDAIIFVKEDFSPNLIADIVDYRIAQNFTNDNKLDFSSLKPILIDYRDGKSSLDQVIASLKNITNDEALAFFKKLK
ncbi:AAA family ATPase [Chryseobacterium sp. S0630]|uniref:ATP-dependent nuclease n=1 Tax=Chryseobacterium sp. S0630 TaxID=2957803 RepID=UPI00209FD742|nr:AAA family ATPase [Chryseobacterium sp. S0630]MCP1297615.1 AAA family ATPase [Chryseobacterium sp. S0630]